jgi:hypothetical protein
MQTLCVQVIFEVGTVPFRVYGFTDGTDGYNTVYDGLWGE